MFDFLVSHNSTGDPTALSIFVAVLFSFLMSSLIVLTYDLTTKRLDRQVHFLQTLALISIVAATVMQAIGDSLARGLGMLGALAIIRFRTRLDNPRNMAFMFASLAVGIATGVFGFTIAFIGTIGFCVGAVLLYYSPLSNTGNLIGSLRVELPKEGSREVLVNEILTKYCHYFELGQIRYFDSRKTEKEPDNEDNVVEKVSRRPMKELNYQFRLKTNATVSEFTREFEQLKDLGEIRLRFDKKNIPL